MWRLPLLLSAFLRTTVDGRGIPFGQSALSAVEAWFDRISLDVDPLDEFDQQFEDDIRESDDDASDSGRECYKDTDCPLRSPLCDRGRYKCKDIWNFNASKGHCRCPGCSRDEELQEIEVKFSERDNASECTYMCKHHPECRGFEGYYADNGTFLCHLFRINRPDAKQLFLDGDGRGGNYCFHRVDSFFKCNSHLACRAMEGGRDLCCPDRNGAIHHCCHYKHKIQVGGYIIAGLVLLLACSMFCNCRTCGKSDLATSASDMPGSQDVQYPRTSGTTIQASSVGPPRRFIIAFVNSGSGDQSGESFQEVFRSHLGADGGLVCKLPDQLKEGFEEAAARTQEGQEVAILACGGDGTVTWILSELNSRRDSLFQEVPVPSVGIIPLGTGNDLARSLGWGPALTDTDQLPSYIQRALFAGNVDLDQWKLVLRPSHLLPSSLQQDGEATFTGYFTNYFSVGMDAATAYEVAKVRSSRLGRCCFRLRCYPPCSFVHGGLLCYGLNGPNCLRCLCCRTRPLNSGDDLNVRLDGESHSFSGNIRQFTLTNLNSYGAGMLLYGADDQVSPNDGKLEVFTRQGPYGVISMTLNKKLLRTTCMGNIPVLSQPRKVEMTLKRGQHFQMDGEPWVLNAPCTATITQHRTVRMLCPSTHGAGQGDWSGSQKRSFWEKSLPGVHREQELAGSGIAQRLSAASSSV
eukprot:symbB.v1.2.025235.t1/scaffold2370.1/size80994/3